MEGLGKRFFYYFIGFGLGCVLVWAMFYRNSDRPSWMPEGRVIEFLESTEVTISEELKCKLGCYDLSSDFLNDEFWEAAEVNFKESATERKPCPEYQITSKDVLIYVEACETKKTATLRSIEKINEKPKQCDCN